MMQIPMSVHAAAGKRTLASWEESCSNRSIDRGGDKARVGTRDGLSMILILKIGNHDESPARDWC